MGMDLSVLSEMYYGFNKSALAAQRKLFSSYFFKSKDRMKGSGGKALTIQTTRAEVLKRVFISI